MPKTRKNIKKFLGGDPIASGSQGCIFLPKLQRNAATNTAIRSANMGTISKVFTDEGVADREYDIMTTVQTATGGVGVVVYSPGEDGKFNVKKLNPVNVGLINKDMGKGCAMVKDAAAAAEAAAPAAPAAAAQARLYVINQPRITGDVRRFQKITQGRRTIRDAMLKPARFFINAYTALLNLRRNKIIHMDMASRNIFYNDREALIGDFGYTIDLKDAELVSAGLREFNKSHGLENGEMNSFVQDQLMPEAFLALSLLYSWANKTECIAHIRSRDSLEIIEMSEYNPVTAESTESGKILINREPYNKYQEVITKADTTADCKEFQKYTYKLLLNSDVKKFIVDIVKYLDIDVTEKYTLLRQTLVDENFGAFFTLAGVEYPPALIAVPDLSEVPLGTICPPGAESAFNNILALRHVGAYNHIRNENLNAQLAEFNNYTFPEIPSGAPQRRKSRRRHRRR